MPAKPRAVLLLPYDSSHQRNTSCRGEQRNPVPLGPLLGAHPVRPSLGLEGCRSALLWHWARIHSHPAEGHVGVCVYVWLAVFYQMNQWEGESEGQVIFILVQKVSLVSE